MGLDVYAGSLIRYYLGYWIITTKRMILAAKGYDPDTLLDRPPDKDIADCAATIERWRSKLERRFKDRIGRLDFDRDVSSRYWVDKPTWDAYASLHVWAAYAMTPGVEPPRKERGVEFTNPVWKQRTRDKTIPIPNFWNGVEIWLPGHHRFTFTANDPFGNRKSFGWTGGLLADLEWINRRTWKASDRTIQRWRREWERDESKAGLFEHDAKFAFSIYYAAAKMAVKRNGVIILDY